MATILVIDDDSSIIQLFKFVFEDAGYSVITASTGMEALEKLSASTPDYMLVDVAMPEMSGAEFIVELSKRARTQPRLRDIPFIVMTGENFFDTELNKTFANVRGFISFYPKMTPPEKILEALTAGAGGR